STLAGLTDAATGAAAVPGANANVLSNTLIARGAEPTATIAVTGDIMFSSNRCELRGNTASDAVRLGGATAIVNANQVRGGEVSIRLLVDLKRVTVLGNIVNTPIAPTLPGVWIPLNVQA